MTIARAFSGRRRWLKVLLFVSLILITGLCVLAYNRYQWVKRIRPIADFERVLVAGSNQNLSKEQITSYFGAPDIVHDAANDEIFVYLANDGLGTFLLYPTRVKIVCRKSDGLMRTFELRSD